MRRIGLSPWGLAIAITAGIAIIIGIAFVTGFLSPPGSPAGPPAVAKSVLRTDAASVTFDDNGNGWVADDQTASVKKFDPGSGNLIGRASHTGGTPIAVASGYGRIWVADPADNEVLAVDANTGKVSGSAVTVAQGPVSIATGEGGVWVASLLSGTITLIAPHTEQVVASVALPDGAVRLTVGGGYVWVTGKTDTLVRVNPHPLGVTLNWRQVRVGQGPIGVAVGQGAVWTANAQAGTVSKVDPSSLKVLGSVRVSTASAGLATGSDPETIAVWNGLVWVGVGQLSEVVALQPGTGAQVGKAVTLPGIARDLTVGPDGNLWAATANAGTVTRLSS